MEVRDFAERILFGTTLEDKLVEPGQYRDQNPGKARAAPRAPGRPQGLELGDWHRREKVRFVQVRRLHTEKERGLALHFFANHELLALELMALALLKFPGAPQQFRRGLVRILRDEQEHVQLYLERMRRVGVEFGEIPVSDFFWKSIAPMESPLDFVARLSLTLEQANLDYAPHYAGLFRRLGDEETARILERIYRDEIGHVRHGLVWFERWKEGGQSTWEAYRRILKAPLTPSRARGIGFNEEGRRRAGLPEAFITELEIYSHSKGRCPAVYWFNPACEGHIAHEGGAFTPGKWAARMGADFAALPMLLCAPEDVVLVGRRPSAAFLHRMRRAGFSLPEFVECAPPGPIPASAELVRRRIAALRPWGWSPDSARFLEPLRANLGPEKERALGWSAALRRLYSKAWGVELLSSFLRSHAAAWLCGEEVVGRVCTGVEQVRKEAEALWAAGFEEVVVKGFFGAAGRNQIHLRPPALRPDQVAWLERVLSQQGGVVVEAWLDKLCDLSLHLELDSGRARVRGWTRFFTDGRGQYRGSFVAQMGAGMGVELRRFLYGDGRDPRRLRRLGEELAAHTAARAGDYAGPLGIDALVYRSREGLRLKPIVEVNPRFSMGRVALNLAKKVNSACTALWLVLGTGEIAAAGFEHAAAFAAWIEENYALEWLEGQIVSGALCTTDPALARGFVSLLLVGQSLEACKSAFSAWEGGLSAWTRYC